MDILMLVSLLLGGASLVVNDVRKTKRIDKSVERYFEKKNAPEKDKKEAKKK